MDSLQAIPGIVMTRFSNQLSAWLRTAAQYLQTGNLPEAESFCARVIAKAPDYPDAIHLMAVIHARTQRYQTANTFFARAAHLDPKRPDFQANYANALWQQGRIDEAMTYCQRALQLVPQDPDALNILGNIQTTQNRLAAAAESFQKALALKPNHVQVLNNLGNVLQRSGKNQEAIACYKKALAWRPNYAEGWNNLGAALKAVNEIDEARGCFARAMEIQPELSRAVWNYAEVDIVWLEQLEGNHLYLRRYAEQDADYLYHCYQNAVFMAQYNHSIPRHQPPEELAAQLRSAQVKHPCQSRSINWIICKKATGRPVGLANLAEIQFLHRRAEFLIGLPDPADHTVGIALEASLLVMDFVFNRVGLNKLTAVVYDDNPVSQKNTLKMGFIQESYLREHIYDSASKKFIHVYGNGMTANSFRHNERLPKLSRRLLGRDVTSVSQIRGAWSRLYESPE